MTTTSGARSSRSEIAPACRETPQLRQRQKCLTQLHLRSHVTLSTECLFGVRSHVLPSTTRSGSPSGRPHSLKESQFRPIWVGSSSVRSVVEVARQSARLRRTRPIATKPWLLSRRCAQLSTSSTRLPAGSLGPQSRMAVHGRTSRDPFGLTAKPHAPHTTSSSRRRSTSESSRWTKRRQLPLTGQ
jgi:hypothetical protein